MANNKVHGSNLLIEPSGDGTAIGDEVDFIMGYEKFKNIDVKFVAGFFLPGSAFIPPADIASRTRFQVEYNF